MSITRVVKSACRMCHGVCQVLVHIEDDRIVKISGDPDSPTSQGYICPKGMASPELLYHPDRLQYPLRRVGRRGESKWERITWDDALAEMTQKFDSIRTQTGPEFLGIVHGTSRPYVDFANRFANAFGTPNFTNVAHICMSARTMANIFSLGNAQLTQPDVYGFGGVTPQCLLLWGTNITEIGVVHGLCGHLVKKALAKTQHVIVVDPRLTKAAEKATHWLQLRPGTDGALALAMLHVIIQEDLIDHDFVDSYTVGYHELQRHIREYSPEWVADITRVKADTIREAARTYAKTKPAAILWGNAIDMSACSFHTARSLMILRAITGNIDRPGGDAIWVTPANVRMKSQFVNSEITGKLFLPLEQINLGNKQVYSPIPMTYPELQPQYTAHPALIAEGVALSGTIPNYLFLLGAVDEQALVINVKGKGLVLIVGCGHQTLPKLLSWIDNVFDEPVHGIIGGLHYPVSDGNTKVLGIPIQKYIGTGKLPWDPVTLEEVQENIRILQDHAVEFVGLSAHDSCQVAINEFRKAFGNEFEEITVGKTIIVANS